MLLLGIKELDVSTQEKGFVEDQAEGSPDLFRGRRRARPEWKRQRPRRPSLTLAAVEREWKALDLRCLSMVIPASDWLIFACFRGALEDSSPPVSFRVAGAPLLRLPAQ